ncbi:MAG TPA: TolC family protein [Vicinamibacterales bacterium]
MSLQRNMSQLIKRTWSCVIVAGCLAVGTNAHAQVSASTAPAALSLDDALQYAIEHYPTVKAALEQVAAATASVSVAKAGYLPRFDSVWQTNRATANNIYGQLLPQSVIPSISGPVLDTTGQSVWGSAVGGLLSWEPVDFGLRSAIVHEAEAGVARARAEEGVTRLAVQNAVGAAYFNVVIAQQGVVSADADVARRKVLAGAVKVLVDNQLRPGAESSRAEAELAAAQTRAIQARQAVTIARSLLERVLGMRSGSVEIAPARLLAVTPAVPVTPDPDPASHPLVQSAQAGVDLARARETVLSKTDRPRLYLQSSVSARGSGANPDGMFDGGADGLWFERANWAAGLQVVIPNLFDFSTLKARRAAAGALTRVEHARNDEAMLNVASDQRTAQAMLDAARAIAQNTPIQLRAAQQSEGQARARFDAGLAGIVEVADSQNLLAGAEYQDAVARVDVWRALLATAVSQGSLEPFIGALRAAGVR